MHKISLDSPDSPIPMHSCVTVDLPQSRSLIYSKPMPRASKLGSRPRHIVRIVVTPFQVQRYKKAHYILLPLLYDHWSSCFAILTSLWICAFILNYLLILNYRPETTHSYLITIRTSRNSHRLWTRLHRIRKPHAL